MKKLLTLFLLCAYSFASAQKADSTKSSRPDSVKATVSVIEPSQEKVTPTFKAFNGNFTTELNVNLFQGNLTFNNALQQIKVRYFAANNIAYRFAFNFNSKTSNDGSSNPYGTNSYNY